jgi:hypothetical protein
VVFIGRETLVDFTLDKYKELCRTLQATGYNPFTVCDYLDDVSDDNPDPEKKIVILRHDVDRKIMNALRMAKMEHEMGIHSTFYFRYPHTFKPDIIRKIQALGHEIGYHYEVLSKVNGDYLKAIALFVHELEEFRKISPIDTICMHGNPLSSIDNRNLWKQYDFHQYGLKGEAYLSISNINYFSDTGRNWNGRNNLRDFIGTGRSSELPETTDALIQLIKKMKFPAIYLTTHPERWAYSYGTLMVSYSTDLMFNFGKKIIRRIRR